MQESRKTTHLVARAKAGDLQAFSRLVRQFQDMAVGYAASRLGDFHLAQDAAQEAFAEAFQQLATLRDPAAFPAWLRKIIFKHCDRITRRARAKTVPLISAIQVASPDPGPAELAERQQTQEAVHEAIESLAPSERTVILLFYISAYTQPEIAAFLGLSTVTVKKRLQSARTKLKERILLMEQENVQWERPSKDDTFVVGVQERVTYLLSYIAATGPDEDVLLRLTNCIILLGVGQGASAILLTPGSNALDVQYRADETLIHRLTLPKSVQDAVTSRLRVMAGLGLVPSGTAREGVIPVQWEDEQYDLPTSAYPGEHGDLLTLSIVPKPMSDRTPQP